MSGRNINDVAALALPVLLDAAAKGLVVLLAAWIVTLLMRKASAAGRHLVWGAAVLGVLVLPGLSVLLPSWHVLPRWVSVPQAPAIRATVVAGPVVLPIPTEGAMPARPAAELPKEPPPAPAPQEAAPASLVSATVATRVAAAWAATWQAWAMFAWAGGMSLALCPVLLSALMLRRLRRISERIDSGSWPLLLRQFQQQLNLRRRVVLLSSSHRAMPMTWGLFHPTVLLPANADTWPAERRRIVLVHELAHVSRRDCLWQLLTQLACAVYWFNPPGVDGAQANADRARAGLR